ncbi:hypothetical protein V8G54_021470 [Vigna mungo]|uniref:Uncharacterized protein n=1 Tax=Vigna mungo TaxID=3915 RepID=A0AAQ3RUC1_VIGMU
MILILQILQFQSNLLLHLEEEFPFSCFSNGKVFDVSNEGPVLPRLWFTFSTQFRTTIYGQIFKGTEAMHVTGEIQQLRTVNNMKHLKMSHCCKPLRKHLKTMQI